MQFAFRLEAQRLNSRVIRGSSKFFKKNKRPTGRPAEFVIARLMMGSSKGELDDLLKDRGAIRKVIIQIVEHSLAESFWNKLEGSAMENDPVMRRLIMRDMLGGE